MKEIPLTQGYVAIVDDEDYDRVLAHRWYAQVVLRSDGTQRVYARRSASKPGGGQVTQRMHRFILDYSGRMDIDHVNGNALDNRRKNIRICTRSENLCNALAQTGKSSRFKGVSWHKKDAKWRVHIRVAGKVKHIGNFTSEIDAAKAYDAAATEMYGDFSRINTYDSEQLDTYE